MKTMEYLKALRLHTEATRVTSFAVEVLT